MNPAFLFLVQCYFPRNNSIFISRKYGYIQVLKRSLHNLKGVLKTCFNIHHHNIDIVSIHLYINKEYNALPASMRLIYWSPILRSRVLLINLPHSSRRRYVKTLEIISNKAPYQIHFNSFHLLSLYAMGKIHLMSIQCYIFLNATNGSRNFLIYICLPH